VQAPRYETSPYARELEVAGLLEVDVGMAKFRRRYDQPVGPVQNCYLSIIDGGRGTLHEHCA